MDMIINIMMSMPDHQNHLKLIQHDLKTEIIIPVSHMYKMLFTLDPTLNQQQYQSQLQEETL